jgi:hypothetical protein
MVISLIVTGQVIERTIKVFLYMLSFFWVSQFSGSQVKSPKSVALSSSEAENFAMSKVVKEVRFIVMVLESLVIEVENPSIIKLDNVGAILMADNVSATRCTKAIDTHYHFVHEFVEENFIKVIFVKTAENKHDMFTKKVGSEVYDDHIDNYVMDRNILSQNG